MPQIPTRPRGDLKTFFVKNAIPTESNFADLIDGVLNQQDDGIAKLPNDALMITATGDATSQKKALHFYAAQGDTDPSWTVSLNPRQNPADAATAKLGFSISDGAGNSRLFVERSTGRVGVGTVGPLQAALHIDRGATNDLALQLSSSGPGWGSGLQLKNTAAGAAKTFGIYTGSGALHFADVDNSIDRMAIGGDGTVWIPSKLAIGVNGPVSDLTLRRDAGGALGPVITLMNAAGSPGAGGALDFDGYNVGTTSPTLRLQSLDDGNFSSHLSISTKNSGGAANPLVERMRITSSGNVGIRSSNPLSTLTIDGANASFRIGSGLTGGNTGNGYVLENDNADDFKLKLRYRNPTNVFSEIVAFHYGGNVGFGTAAPRGRIDVPRGDVWVGQQLHISAPSDGTNGGVLNLYNETNHKFWHINIRSGEADKLIFWRNDTATWLAVLKLGMDGVVEAPSGALLNAIGVGTQTYGTTQFPYETIQMNPAHNLRLWFGTTQRFLFDNAGNLSTAASISGGETATGWTLGRGAWGPDNWLRLTTTHLGSTYHDLAVNSFFAAGAKRFDLAEVTPVRADDQLEQGDVVVIDREDGMRVRRSTRPYDPAVYGIVSSYAQAAMVIGGFGGPEEMMQAPDKRPIALVGRVKIKVCGETGPIRVGDPLTTSSRPGHAMRCDDPAAHPGAIAGKALEPFSGDTGTIMALVALQ